MHLQQHCINLCNAALDALRPLIPGDSARDVDAYINRFNEWGLGVEILIDQVIEDEIEISPEQFESIRMAMSAMGQDDSARVIYLRRQVVSRSEAIASCPKSPLMGLAMPGPTTESLATDFRDVQREMTAIRSDIASFREDHADFRGRVETQLSFIRWLGAFTAALLVTLVGSAIWLAWHASALAQQVDALNRTAAKAIDRLDQSNSPPKPKTSTP